MGVQPLELGGNDARLRGVLSSQKIDHDVGVTKPPEGVHARGDAKADVGFIDGERIDACQFVKNLQPEAFGLAQFDQAELEQITDIAVQVGYIGGDAEGDEVEQV